jgi:hypothetical protein
MQTLKSNDFYTVAVDGIKNRLYLTIKGSWKSREQVPDFVKDVEAGAKRLRPGFGAMVDLTKMGPTLIPGVHKEAIEASVSAGMRKAAEILDSQVILKLQVEQVVEDQFVARKRFSDPKEAEAWLDE